MGGARPPEDRVTSGSVARGCFVDHASMASNTWEHPVKRLESAARLRAVNFDKMLLLPLLSNPESRKEVGRDDPDKVCLAKWPVKLRRSLSDILWLQVACPAVLKP